MIHHLHAQILKLLAQLSNMRKERDMEEALVQHMTDLTPYPPSFYARRNAHSIPYRRFLVDNMRLRAKHRRDRWAAWTAKFIQKPLEEQQRIINSTSWWISIRRENYWNARYPPSRYWYFDDVY